ncbi:MAG: helix-turn-helix domain-containing protein [Bacteroidetes bacterium]|nr:helix-turn-helix domain-containing protein [Bacteroidota bacterium]
MEKENIHIGNMIKVRMKEMRLSPTEFAKRLGYSLPGTTSIFERQTMQTDVLLKVCKALDYDFFKHYVSSDLIQDDGKKVIEDAALQKELDACKTEIADLKKELEYLKKIVRLYEEKK